MVHYFWATVCQSQHKVKTITVCQAFIMNLDERGIQTREEARHGRRRERRAAESSEERETQFIIAKHHVADRATYAPNSDGRTERRRERRC